MTGDDLTWDLVALRWSGRSLAAAVNVSEGTVRLWLAGQSPIPEEVATWIRKLTAAHRRYPAPTVILKRGRVPRA